MHMVREGDAPNRAFASASWTQMEGRLEYGSVCGLIRCACVSEQHK